MAIFLFVGTFAVSAALAATMSTNGLIGFWMAEGDAVDSANGNNGTFRRTGLQAFPFQENQVYFAKYNEKFYCKDLYIRHLY